MIHPLFTVSVAFAALGLVPLLGTEIFSRRDWYLTAGTLAIGALIAAIVAGFQPAFSPDAPQRVNIVYSEDHTSGAAKWSVSATPLPEGLRAAANFSEQPQAVLPLDLLRGFVADAGKARLDAPQLSILSDTRSSRGRLLELSFGGSPVTASMYLVVPAAARATLLNIDGRQMSAPPEGGDVMLSCQGSDCAGLHVALTLGASTPFDLFYAEQRYGLPPEGAKLIAARGEAAVPASGGDLTIVLNKLQVR